VFLISEVKIYFKKPKFYLTCKMSILISKNDFFGEIYDEDEKLNPS